MAVSGEEAPSSPRGRLKFLCSFGGRILPRPSDGQLKYVGGETRFVAFPRSVNFSELRRKMGSVFNGEAVIKYQMASDDLDALVSVTCDDDLLHMLEEYDRHEARPSNCSCSHPARLRVFLFPPAPAPAAFDVQHHHPHPPHHLTPEQRYIDAVNGVSRPPPAAASALRIPTFTLSSSAESSPTSTSELVGHDAPAMLWWGGGSRRGGGGGRALQEFHRVHSSPNLHSPGHRQQQQPSQGWRMPGHHHPPPHHHPAGRRYYNSPTATATRDESGACACCGHVEE